MKIGIAWGTPRAVRRYTRCQCQLGCTAVARGWGYDNIYREIPVAPGHGRTVKGEQS
jgi:hypothetical protein